MRKPWPSLRVLPVLVAVIIVSLGIRLDTFWQQAIAEDTRSPETIAPLQQADEQPPPPATGPEKKPLSELVSPEESDEEFLDITEFSSSELSLLQSLRERREELVKREAILQQKEQLLTGMEQRLKQKIDELNGIRIEIEELKKEIDRKSERFRTRENEQIAALVRVYEKMKPKEAARIFDNLELIILLDVIKGMKEAKLAPVLAGMDPVKAKEVTAALGRRDELPSLESQEKTGASMEE